MKKSKIQLFSDNIILVVLAMLLPIWETYGYFVKQEVPRWVFVTMFIGIVVGFVYVIVVNKNEIEAVQVQYKNERNLLYKEMKRKKKHLTRRMIEVQEEVEKLREKTNEEIKLCKKYGKWRVAICAILLVALFVRNPENVKAFGEVIFSTNSSAEEIEQDNPENTGEIDSEESSTVKGEEGECDENKTDIKGSEYAPQRTRAKGYYFVLDNPDCAPVIKAEIKQQVYFYQDEKATPIREAIPSYLEKLFSKKKASIDTAELVDQFGNTFYTYTDVEDTFKQNVMEALAIEYYDAWEMAAPSSHEYDVVILGRESLCSVEKDGKTGSYELCWKLANDYQYYAQEYERQTENKQAILYYYTMSIHYCIEALQYDMDEAAYDLIYEYMVERYHDLARDEACISDKYKERAQVIWDALQNDVN